MDDGYKFNKGFYICTESFNQKEHEMLINILKKNFNLESNFHKTTNGLRLYIHSTSRDNLLSLIKPYLISHFYYKFEINNNYLFHIQYTCLYVCSALLFLRFNPPEKLEEKTNTHVNSPQIMQYRQ